MVRAFSFLLVLTVLFNSATVWPDDQLDQILKHIQGNYDHLSGLTTAYTREVITRSMSLLGTQVKGDLATGKIHFRSPYFLRLEQQTPKTESIIANHETLWWYVPEKNEAHKYSSRAFGRELKLLGDIFRGLRKVEDRFQVSLITEPGQDGYLVELRPGEDWQEIERITLRLTEEYLVSQVDILNLMGTVTRFTLFDLVARDDFETGFFDFVLPEGVKVIEEGES